jgi:hypothetical protein
MFWQGRILGRAKAKNLLEDLFLQSVIVLALVGNFGCCIIYKTWRKQHLVVEEGVIHTRTGW